MAKASLIEARKAKAQQEISRKIDLIMEHLGIEDPKAPKAPEVDSETQAAAEAEAKADAEQAERLAAMEEEKERLAEEAGSNPPGPGVPNAADVVGTEAATSVPLPKAGEPVEKPQPKVTRTSGTKKK